MPEVFYQASKYSWILWTSRRDIQGWQTMGWQNHSGAG